MENRYTFFPHLAQTHTHRISSCRLVCHRSILVCSGAWTWKWMFSCVACKRCCVLTWIHILLASIFMWEVVSTHAIICVHGKKELFFHFGILCYHLCTWENDEKEMVNRKAVYIRTEHMFPWDWVVVRAKLFHSRRIQRNAIGVNVIWAFNIRYTP